MTKRKIDTCEYAIDREYDARHRFLACCIWIERHGPTALTPLTSVSACARCKNYRENKK